MSVALVAADLDRTLIYSRSAISGADAACLVRVEASASGHESFVTGDAAALLTRLATEHLLVPVTTRTVEQLARVSLPGPAPRYAVAANGGVLLVDGVIDPDWAAVVTARLAGGAPLTAALAAITRYLPAAAVIDRRAAQGLFCYAIVDRAAIAPDAIEGLRHWAQPAGWTMSLQGRKLYLVPRRLTKSAAVAEVARRCVADVVLAAGDSWLDLDLLQSADRAIRPGHGELALAGWCEPHVRALDTVGIAAGQEIAAWLLEQATAVAEARVRSLR